MLIGLVALIAIGGVIAWKLITGLRTGIFHERQGAVDRKTAPALYWFSAACQCCLLAFILGGLTMIFLRL